MKTLMVVLFLLVTSLSSNVMAEQIGAVNVSGITVALFNDPCRLTNKITNLPYRTTWTSGGKTIEGCFGLFQEAGAIGSYFEDLTTAVIPMSIVKPVQEM